MSIRTYLYEHVTRRVVVLEGQTKDVSFKLMNIIPTKVDLKDRTQIRNSYQETYE